MQFCLPSFPADTSSALWLLVNSFLAKHSVDADFWWDSSEQGRTAVRDLKVQLNAQNQQNASPAPEYCYSSDGTGCYGPILQSDAR